MHSVSDGEFHFFHVRQIAHGFYIVDHVILSSDSRISSGMEFVEEYLFDGFLSGYLLFFENEILHQRLKFPFTIIIKDDLDLLSFIHEDVFAAGVLYPE